MMLEYLTIFWIVSFLGTEHRAPTTFDDTLNYLLFLKMSIILFISAPKNNVYIHVYVHIIISIIVVKLPYISENPLNIFRYFANINDTMFSPIEPINAPGICDSIFTLCLGINFVYSNIHKKCENYIP